MTLNVGAGRRIRRSLLQYFSAAAFCVSIATSLLAQEPKEKVNVDGVTREYIVHLPARYEAEKQYPVVILLHGSNQDADDMSRLTLFNQLADNAGVIAVYPNSAHGQWNFGVRPEQTNFAPQQRRPYGRGGWPGGGYPGGGYPGSGYPAGQRYPRGGQNPQENRDRQERPDDVAFLNSMLDALALKYPIDPARIYATGLEDGGFMAQRVGCTMSDRVAAVAAVGAEMPKTMICLPSRAVPVLMIDGTDDPIVPYSGGTYKAGRFKVLSAEESAKTWARFDRCAEKPEEDKIPAPKGSKDTKTFNYNGCQNNAQVALYSLKGGGNTWPGGEQYMTEKEIGKVSKAINANEVIWKFFSEHKLATDAAQK